MLDIFNNDAFSTTSIAAALKNVPYKPSRLGPGGMALFDEKPIATTSLIVESIGGQLALIADTPRGAPGDFIGVQKGKQRAFVARHLRRNAKIFADEVQNVRVFGSEDQMLTIEQLRNDRLAIIQSNHEVTWEFHRVGALLGKVLDADGTTVLLDIYSEFGVTQTVIDFPFGTATTDVRSVADSVADAIDDELGAATYDHIHVFAGANWYDAMIKHKYVQDALKASLGATDRLLGDLTKGFTIGQITFERARRWRVRNAAGTLIDMIDPNVAYAFPVGATLDGGNIFIGRFAPQPFLDTVNRLNPPLVVKTVVDPGQQFIDLFGISCPLYLNTRPGAVIKLTKS